MSTRARSGEEQSAKHPYHHGNLREALVEAAIEILAEQGADAMGLRCAARAAGVSAAAPYHHFGSKEGLLAAVAAEGFRRLAVWQANTLDETGHDRTPREHINALGRTYIRFARAHPELYRLMFGRGIEHPDAYPELVDAVEASYQQIVRAIESLLASRPDGGVLPKVAINGAWSVVHGLSILLIDGKIKPGELGNPDEDALIESILEIWGRGVEQGLAGFEPGANG